MLAFDFVLAAGSALLLLTAEVEARPGLPRQPRSCKPDPKGFQIPPAQATALSTDGLCAKYAAIGVGVQLYNCSNSAWITNGALATLYDASCVPSTILNALSTQAATFANQSSNPSAVSSGLAKIAKIPLPQLGKHYFVPTPGGAPNAISPKFDFSKSAGGTLSGDASFFLGAKANSTASPSGSQNVAWLKLTQVQGSLAKEVFRIYTVNGQATGSCTAGQQTSVGYAAQYWFFV